MSESRRRRPTGDGVADEEQCEEPASLPWHDDRHAAARARGQVLQERSAVVHRLEQLLRGAITATVIPQAGTKPCPRDVRERQTASPRA